MNSVRTVCTMNRNVPPIPMPLLAYTTVLFFALFVCVISLLVEEEERGRTEALLGHSLVMIREGRKRRGGDTGDIAQKKTYNNWGRDWARQCIQQDYFGPVPRFNQNDFKRMFRVSNQNYERIRNILCQSDSFFSDTYDA